MLAVLGRVFGGHVERLSLTKLLQSKQGQTSHMRNIQFPLKNTDVFFSFGSANTVTSISQPTAKSDPKQREAHPDGGDQPVLKAVKRHQTSCE